LEAWRALEDTNNFPEFTGRLCPAPCEAACVLALQDSPVAIEQIEKELAERAFASGWVQPRPPLRRTGKRVAVVGAGPAGMAAAAQLNQAGHRVVLYERDAKVGGLLRYGIPDFKLDKAVIERRLEVMLAEGVELRAGVEVGRDVSWEALRDQHDALLLCLGARAPRRLEVEGAGLPGVYLAMAFLGAQNRALGGELAQVPAHLDARGKRVVVLGGGDTGSDCLGTALRQGAASVVQVELLPTPPDKRAPQNPWPTWPQVFRVSSSQAEGGERLFGVRTLRLEAESGRLARLCAERVALEGGRLVAVEGEGLTLDVDLLLLALGFVGPELGGAQAALGLTLDARGNIKTDRGLWTGVPGVYAAGDVARGASLIVWAISQGREAARSVDAWLQGRASHLPTRGADLAF
jgi:glutamate synthase (NADPH/NADH) small chain